MRTLYRYISLFLGALVYVWLLFAEFSGSDHYQTEFSESFWSHGEGRSGIPDEMEKPCSMSSCFNYSRCLDSKKVYVYPNGDGEPQSGAYLKILTSIIESSAFTSNPYEACLLVLHIDTTDRDRISQNYVRDVNELISTLPADIWNNGMNHVIFNLYHGTFPDYADHNLGFNTGKAIIARASPGAQHFRFGFDISFPLFHKEHDLRGRIEREYELTAHDQYLVSFKGKRYVYGIGSETRDALHHLHNGISVAMVTTCKHNNDWKEHQDSRCEKDNEEYDRWDYVSTMANSTFCLTPRGRRLGSFRFLESLRLGCIPVVLSDDWILPFAEVIDWTAAVVVVPEDSVLLVPDILYTFSPATIVRMKQQCRFLYNRYFRDVESITMSSLEIIFDRVRESEAEATRDWNAVTVPIIQSSDPFSIVIHVSAKHSNNLQRLMSMVSSAFDLDKVVIVWPESRGVPPVGADFGTVVKPTFINDDGAMFRNLMKIVDGDQAVIMIDEREDVSMNDIESILHHLRGDPLRLVGVHGIDYDISSGNVAFSNTYNAAFSSLIGFHSSYLPLSSALTNSSGCESLAINVVATVKSLQSPILIGSRTPPKWANLQAETDCWKHMITRYPLGPTLFYSDLRHV